MNSNFWGPSGWRFLHSITFAYPENPTKQDKYNMSTFFNSVGKVLPCEQCRNNYKNHLIKYPIDDNVLSSRHTLTRWLVDVHNEVNMLLGKSVMPYEVVVSMYTVQVSNRKYKMLLCMLTVILIVLLLYIKK